MLGGPKVPGIGFAMGIERLVLLLKRLEDHGDQSAEIDVFIAGLGEEAADYSFKLMHGLRGIGLRVDMDLDTRSLKSQMKQADRSGAGYTVIVGSQELDNQQVVLRNMKTGEQTDLNVDAITDFFNETYGL